jgi:hypothetical protein
MGDRQIFLKTHRDVSFNKVLWNEPTFFFSAGSISQDSTFNNDFHAKTEAWEGIESLPHLPFKRTISTDSLFC